MFEGLDCSVKIAFIILQTSKSAEDCQLESLLELFLLHVPLYQKMKVCAQFCSVLASVERPYWLFKIQ